jgi:hypothetical protein
MEINYYLKEKTMFVVLTNEVQLNIQYQYLRHFYCIFIQLEQSILHFILNHTPYHRSFITMKYFDSSVWKIKKQTPTF